MDYVFFVCRELGTDSSEGLFDPQVSPVFSAVVGSDEVKELLHSSHLLPLHRGGVRGNLDSVSTLIYSRLYLCCTITDFGQCNILIQQRLP